MKRTAIALLVALLVAPSVVEAGDTSPCVVIADPLGDVAAADAVATSAQPAWLDLTALRAGADVFVLDVHGLAELDPATPGNAVYEVTWRAGSSRSYARAVWTAGHWRFQHGRIVSDAARTSRRAGGEAGARHLTIRTSLPDVLHDVRARAAHEPADGGAPTFADRTPNLGARGPSVRPGRSCIDGAGARCPVTGDRIDDQRVARPDQQPSQTTADAGEIAAVNLAANPTAVIAEVVLASAEPIASAEGERWEVVWQNPWLDEQRARQAVFAERRGPRLEFGYDIGDGWTTTQGALDDTVVRIAVPRQALSTPDGTRIRDVAAASYAVRGTTLEMRDRAPDAGGAAWVVGSSCRQREAPVCPVVIDARGDGRLVDADGDAARNEGWLDIRAAGARATDEQLVMSVRVVSFRDDAPTGADLTGWTVSWDHAGRRWFAQAERGTGAVTYRFGARGDGAGPVFGGVRTGGVVDAARDLITIAVPRSSVGAPADGTPLDGFEASSWGSYGTGTTAATIQVVDTTATRRYLTGVDCGA